jgi:hypothetical protein
VASPEEASQVHNLADYSTMQCSCPMQLGLHRLSSTLACALARLSGRGQCRLNSLGIMCYCGTNLLPQHPGALPPAPAPQVKELIYRIKQGEWSHVTDSGETIAP